MEIKIKKMGEDQNVYSPNRTGFTDAQTVERLYEERINRILKSDNPALTEKIKDQLVKRLQRCLFYDPRLPDVYYGSAEAADKAQQIAQKLHKMTQDEFLASDYPYLWLGELGKASLFKIIDKDVLKPAEVNKGKMSVCLGEDKEGNEIYVDLEKEGIRLILLAGSAGSGKSVFDHYLYRQLMENNTPQELSLVLLDPTRTAFVDLKYPHLLYPPVTDPDRALTVLEEVAEIAESRAKGEKDNTGVIIVHLEECDLFQLNRSRVYKALDKLIQTKAKSNVYFVFSTSRPDPEYLTDYLIRNFDLKVVFNCAHPKDSNLLLGNSLATTFTQPGERVIAYNNKQFLCQPLSNNK